MERGYLDKHHRDPIRSAMHIWFRGHFTLADETVNPLALPAGRGPGELQREKVLVYSRQGRLGVKTRQIPHRVRPLDWKETADGTSVVMRRHCFPWKLFVAF